MQLSAALVAPQEWSGAVEALVGQVGLATVPLTRLGDVPEYDVAPVLAALGAAVAQVPAPVLSFAGAVDVPRPTDPRLVCGFALEDPDGAAATLFRTVHEALQRVGILVDRRTYRTVLQVPMTRRPLPSRAWADTLVAVAPWQVTEVALLRTRPESAASLHDVVQVLPVGVG